ncbi:hypothetical protein F0310_04995 (plasmid) [Borrelia sp. A-FGy1]|uniref:hypothetical protein n=1 Tax=Borrelia sp. A-FGy1 TaxID=2608247 RepID=UPI0015F3590D|nr:hypothetical protein [Borrelia sp. A-FGy1]QMU99774.1 hypothetical protein F0310_04995 [Borrelia sp. A-FGy1]
MKKINIMFFLILAIAFLACKQETAVSEKEEEKTVTGAKETEEFKKKIEAGVTKELTKRENAATLAELKNEISKYKKEIDDAKAGYEATTSGSKKAITIPAEVTDVTSSDLEMIYSGLGYDNNTIGKLHDSIVALNISSGKTDEIKFANGVLKLLKSIGKDTKNVLEVYLGDTGSLSKIENDKAKMESAKIKVKEFIDARKTLITALRAQIGAAETAKSNPSNLKTELEKISDTTPNVSSSSAKGYYWSKYNKEVKAKAVEIGDLVK